MTDEDRARRQIRDAVLGGLEDSSYPPHALFAGLIAAAMRIVAQHGISQLEVATTVDDCLRDEGIDVGAWGDR